MNYLFLFLFWIGILLIFIKEKNLGLKERADIFYGKLSDAGRQSAVSKAVERIINQRKKDTLSEELLSSLSYVKNIVILGRSKEMSAQSLLEDLADFSTGLGPVFLEMSGYINLNEKKMAADCLKKAIGTSIASDVGVFLAGWEELPPSDIVNTVDLYLTVLKEQRISSRRKKDEFISDLVYIPVVINCMLVLLNFIYIAYFIEQKEALSVLF